jgi:molybdopterin synthase sulfur carrier subunit
MVAPRLRPRSVAELRLFAAAREAAGTATAVIDAPTVGAVLAEARVRFGTQFAAVLDTSRVWLNGEPTTDDAPLGERDTVAVLPPVSGG